jgi:hypothetical protein
MSKIVCALMIGMLNMSAAGAQWWSSDTNTPIPKPTARSTAAATPRPTSTPTNSIAKDPFRVVLSNVESLGTAEYNSAGKFVAQKGVSLVAVGSGQVFSMNSAGAFAVTDTVSQINFVLAPRFNLLSTTDQICIDRLKALQAASSKAKLEISFRGRKLGTGNYLSNDILGCGDVLKASTLPVKTPIPATK